MATFQERLEEAIFLRDLSPAELSRVSGVNEGSISQYRSGAYKASQRSLEKLSKALNVSIPWLMGADVPMEISDSSDLNSIPNMIPLTTKKLPLVGQIACGLPILAEENISRYIDVLDSVRADFCLECKGDSMTGARINDGDIVCIRLQPEVEPGQIAAVRIGDEATLKRVYYYPDKLVLQAENPAYPPQIYTDQDLEDIEIIGKAVAFVSLVK